MLVWLGNLNWESFFISFLCRLPSNNIKPDKIRFDIWVALRPWKKILQFKQYLRFCLGRKVVNIRYEARSSEDYVLYTDCATKYNSPLLQMKPPIGVDGWSGHGEDPTNHIRLDSVHPRPVVWMDEDWFGSESPAAKADIQWRIGSTSRIFHQRGAECLPTTMAM